MPSDMIYTCSVPDIPLLRPVIPPACVCCCYCCRFVLRLSCGSCGVAALQQLFGQAGDSSLLQQTDLLLLDIQLPPRELAASSAGAAAAAAVCSEKQLAGMTAAAAPVDAGVTQQSTGEAAAEAAAQRRSCAADGSTISDAAGGCSDEGCSEASSSSSSSSSCEAGSDAQTCGDTSCSTAGSLQDLAAVYNLLYQQHGFVGFMRQQLSCGVVRLGWVRQPARMAARAAAVGSDLDVALLRQLGV
jgi:hypothetical protein